MIVYRLKLRLRFFVSSQCTSQTNDKLQCKAGFVLLGTIAEGCADSLRYMHLIIAIASIGTDFTISSSSV